MQLKKKDYFFWIINKLARFKNEHKNEFNVNYKCKIKNMPSKIYISNQTVMIKQRHASENFRIKDIIEVKYCVKWWCIEVEIDTNLGVFKCHFPTSQQAKKCYEHLIYEKVRLQKY